jgi:hypothetical protein
MHDLTAVQFDEVEARGVFIHALAITTKMPDSAPLPATSTPAVRWALGARRSQLLRHRRQRLLLQVLPRRRVFNGARFRRAAVQQRPHMDDLFACAP